MNDIHHPDGPSVTYYRKRCSGFLSAPSGGDAEMGTDMHERSNSGDVTGLSWYDVEALKFYWEECERQVEEIFGQEKPQERREQIVKIHYESGSVATYGTPDRYYYAGDIGLVIDGKFGWYPPTDPIQIKLYTLGVAQKHTLTAARGVLISPRAQHNRVQVWTWSREDLSGALREWAEITEQAREALRLGPAVDVCGHCVNLPHCPAARRLTEEAIERRRTELADPKSVAENLERCMVAKKFIERYQSWALSEIRKGFSVPGWSAQSRSGRTKVTNHEAFREALSDVVGGADLRSCASLSVAKVRDLFVRRWSERTGSTLREAAEEFQCRTEDSTEAGDETYSLKRDA